MAKPGRLTDYIPIYDEQAEKLCRLGAIDRDLADFFGVTERTITNWKKRHPDFFASIKKGKLLADINVADALYKRATGYENKATKFFQHQGKILNQDYTEHYPPDVAAITLWLRARRPDLWRDNKQEEPAMEKRVKITLDLGNDEDNEA